MVSEVRRQQSREVLEEVEERDQEERQADEVRRPLAPPELADGPRGDPNGGAQQAQHEDRQLRCLLAAHLFELRWWRVGGARCRGLGLTLELREHDDAL